MNPMRSGNFYGEKVICMRNGWQKEQDQQFFYNVIQAFKKR